MKNYIEEAKEIGLNISYNYSDRGIVSYSINRYNNNVYIKYLNGTVDYKPIEDIDVDILNWRIKLGLDECKERIFPVADKKIRLNIGIGVVEFVLGNIFTGFNFHFVGGLCSGMAGNMFGRAAIVKGLKREMNLVSWIYDNSEDVNAVIKEEVDSKIKKPITRENAINKPTYDYPSELVPYPEEIYNEGINLNNIDYLKNRELRKLKRKVIKRKNN